MAVRKVEEIFQINDKNERRIAEIKFSEEYIELLDDDNERKICIYRKDFEDFINGLIDIRDKYLKE